MKTVEVELSMPELKRVTFNPNDSALVIVDMQNEFIKSAGKNYLGERADNIIPNIAKLIKKFREAGSKIIYVQSVRKPDAIEFTVFNCNVVLLENTWGSEIIEELTPLPGETVVQKWNHDAWTHTNMEEVLESMDLVPARSQILVTGVGTKVCADCAFTGFRERDYYVYMPVDAAATRTYDGELAAYGRFKATGTPNVFFTRSDLVDFS